MSYMINDLSASEFGIQELTIDETNEVNGGNPAVVVVVVIVAVVFLAGAIDGWFDQGDKK